jgi:uncharacterized membrane protein SpoIIM required for sporulation
MKQQQFEQAHAAQWQRLRTLLRVLDRGSAPMAGAAAAELPRLLRVVSGHCALARSRGYSPGLVSDLQLLAEAGYRLLYRPRPRWPRRVFAFLATGFPRALRRNAALFWLACALFFGPMTVMGLACAADGTLIHSLLDADDIASLESMYDPTNRKLGRPAQRQADGDMMMFGYYVRNNVGIAFRTFALGLLFGVGSVFILGFNGLVTGAAAGHLTQLGYGEPFWSFVSGHSSLELTAIAVAGSAGLLLAKALLAPGRRTRAAALRANAAEALPLIVGAMCLLLLAAAVEAFWSSSPAPAPAVKYAVGFTGWLLLGAYLTVAGREAADGA